MNARNAQFSSNNSLDSGHTNSDLQKTSLQCIITLDDLQDYPSKQISPGTFQNNSSQIYSLPLLTTNEGIHKILPRNCASQWSIINVALMEQEGNDKLDDIKPLKPARVNSRTTVWGLVRFLCCGFLTAPKWTISATQMYSCFIECPCFARPLYQHSTVLCDEAQNFSTESIKVIGLRLLNLPSHLEYQSEYTDPFCQKAHVIMLGTDTWMKRTNLLAYLLVWGSDNAPVLWNDSAKNTIIPRSVISKGQTIEGKRQRLFYTRSLKLKGNENYHWCLGMSQALATESEKLNLPGTCTINSGVSKLKDSKRNSSVLDKSVKLEAGSSIRTIKFIGKVLKSIFTSKRTHSSTLKQGKIPSPCYLQARTVNGRVSDRKNTRDSGHFRWAVASQDRVTVHFDVINPIKHFQWVTKANVTIVERNSDHLNRESISQCNKFGTITVHRPDYHPAYFGQDAFRVQKIGIRRNPPIRELSHLSERIRRGDRARSPYFQPHFYRKKVRRLSSESRGICSVFAGTIQRTFSSSNLEALRKHNQSEGGNEFSRLTEVTIVPSSPPVYVSTQDVEPEFSIYQSIKTPTGTKCERPKSVQRRSLVSHVENCRISGFGDVWTPEEICHSTSDEKIINDVESDKSNSSFSGSVDMESSIELTFSTTATSSINSDDFIRSYSTTTSVTVDNEATSLGNEMQISQRKSSTEVTAQSTTGKSGTISLGQNFTPSGQTSSRRKTLGRRKKSLLDGTTDERNNQIICKATMLTDNHILQKLGNKAHLEASTKIIPDMPAKRKQQPDWRQTGNCDSTIAYVDLTEALTTTVDQCAIFLSCDHANTATHE
ncbi:unnamed protein product [Calicophoron daubneyi]|uniref:Uncharacterized protein n=1 Tax=Calicophoron daubneyi TaxID=300641 RepID=A0AAV2U037_CALDB